MKIESLITIGVIIYIIVSIKKALSFGKKTDGTAKPSGWKQKLKDMADQIKQEIEKANMEMAPPKPTEKNEETDLYWDEETDYDDELEIEELELPSSPAVIRESVLYETRTTSNVEVEIPEESHRNIRKSQPVPVLPETRCHGPRTRFKRVGKKRLRQAVIWAEIIDKPVAFRD